MKILFACVFSCLFAMPEISLKERYLFQCKSQSDMKHHVKTLADYASRCESSVEIGIRSVVSTWGVLYGLSVNGKKKKEYTGIDISDPIPESFAFAKKLAADNGITFTFIKKDDRFIDMPNTDLLFIDSLHTYCHLTYELETFHSKVRKYLIMHDTSAPWGHQDETDYGGDYSWYPEWIDKAKRGLWPAAEDFLARHPEWELELRKYNSHGLVVLKRVFLNN